MATIVMRGLAGVTSRDEHVKPLPTRPITFEEFLDWCDSETRAEWVNGKVVLLMSPASVQHQDIGSFLEILLQRFVRTHRLGKVVRAPFLMRLDNVPSAREPDLMFISRERLECLKHTYFAGSADLAVEIVSPESRRRDRKEKLWEYEEAGVSEYWLIDPLKHDVTFYVLGEDRRYTPAELSKDGVFHSRVLKGLYVRVAWIWELPDPFDILRELGLINGESGGGR